MVLLPVAAASDNYWRIKVSQIPCWSSMRAPAGCLQYFTGVRSTVTSFNWDGTTACSSGCFLKDQAYRACFRPEKGMCGMRYSETDSESSSVDTLRFQVLTDRPWIGIVAHIYLKVAMLLILPTPPEWCMLLNPSHGTLELSQYPVKVKTRLEDSALLPCKRHVLQSDMVKIRMEHKNMCNLYGNWIYFLRYVPYWNILHVYMTHLVFNLRI